MNIEELTIKQVRDIQSLFGAREAAHPWMIGEKYLIRTVTMTQVGRLTHVYSGELVLDEASWVADTGRFHDALAKGTLSEVEPIIGPAIIGRGAIVDACLWKHELPKVQK